MSYKFVAITTGDLNGVGLEVSAKALSQIPASIKKNRAIFFLFRDHKQSVVQKKYFQLLDRTWLRLQFDSLEKALHFVRATKNSLPDNALIDLSLKTSPAEWVYESTLACAKKSLDSLVTGPLSKKLTARLPKKPIGHTGIFRQIFPKNTFFMSFIGQDFNVVLATDHLAFSDVEKTLTKKLLTSSFAATKKLKTKMRSRKKIAVLGLNPHSGEGGLIGRFEKRTMSRLPAGVDGPLSPDAAFLKKNWKKYSFFICLYHDQGLIPFKMHHGQESGVHLTLGLPFVRTSVDHGTAYDLFNKDLADSRSMLEAIKLNLTLIGA